MLSVLSNLRISLFLTELLRLVLCFFCCSRLTDITIISSVTTIRNYAFNIVSGIRSFINMAATPQTINENVFNGVLITGGALYFLIPSL
jgi:hypothetical protein